MICELVDDCEINGNRVGLVRNGLEIVWRLKSHRESRRDLENILEGKI